MLVSGIKSYVKEQVKTATENFNSQLLHENSEAVHDLRVALKKLRALCNFNDIVYRRSKTKRLYNKKLKPFFKVSGKIRNYQIFIELIKKFEKDMLCDLTSVKEYISHRMENQFVLLNKLMPYVTDDIFTEIGSLIVEEANSAGEKINYKGMNKYLKKTWKKIKRNRKKINVKRLHQQRKLFKQYRYIVEMLYGNDREEIILEIEKAEDILGEWHDLNEFKVMLLQYLSQNKEVSEEITSKVKDILTSVSDDIINYIDEYLRISPGLIKQLKVN